MDEIPEDVKIIESCGCVACDLGIEPHLYQGRLVHFTPPGTDGPIPCSKRTAPTAQIFDLSERRNASEKPDPEHVRKDDFGRPLYRFLLGYEYDGSQWGTEVWAYSFEDAEGRVAAMRQSLVLRGQAYSTIPG